MNNNKISSKTEKIKQQIDAAKKVKSEELAKAILHKAFSLRKSILLAAIICLLSGCASETGWRFEIGVSPVKELNNQAGLKQAPPEKVRY